MGVYFHSDIRRLTYGELWAISSTFRGFLRGCVWKLVGYRPPVRFGVWHDESVIEVPEDQVPASAMEQLLPLVEEFLQLGAKVLFYQTVPSSANLQGHAAVLLNAEHNAMVVIPFSKVLTSRRAGKPAKCVLVSELHDGTLLHTSNGKRHYIPPPGFQVFRRLGATPAALCQIHQQALKDTGSVPIPIPDAAKAKQILIEAKRRNFNWQVRRGVWVPLTEEELIRLGLDRDEQEAQPTSLAIQTGGGLRSAKPR